MSFLKKMIRFFLFSAVFFMAASVFAETGEISAENAQNTSQPVETLPETSPNETVGRPAEQKTKKEEIKWRFYSKNKSHIFIDQKINSGENRDNYAIFETEDFGEVTYTNYTFGIRKTLLFFIDKEFDPSVRNFDYVYSDEHFNHCWEQYLDRLYMKGKWKNIQFTAGDFYESMNRGMAFSMKNDQVYGDNSIRGGNIAANYNGFFIKAFGGRANPQLRDSATFRRMNEADDWLAGMETGYKWKIAEFGVQYGYGNYGNYDLITPNKEASVKKRLGTEKEFHLTGAYLALRNPFPRFSFYAGAVYVPYGYETTTETTQIKENEPREDREEKDLQNAAAFYSSALYYFDFGEKKSRLTFKLEAKMYNKFFLNYNRMEDSDYQKRRYFNPPTLLPQDLQIDNEFDTWAVGGRISYNENYSGAKFHFDLVKGDGLGNRDSLPSNRIGAIISYQSEDFWYTALSGEKEWQHFSLGAGVGWHTVDGNSDRKNSRDWIISYLHLGGYVSDFSIKFNNDYYVKDYWLDDVHEMDDVHELKSVLEFTWKHQRVHELFAALKNTTWVEKDEGGSYSPDFYTGGSIGYKYRFLRAYVFGGLEKGGFTCDGGTCRYLPDFKGVKLELEVDL